MSDEMTDARASYITSIDDISGRRTSFYFDRLSTAESFAAEFSETTSQSSPPHSCAAARALVRPRSVCETDGGGRHGHKPHPSSGARGAHQT